jgi:hypothetical protein
MPIPSPSESHHDSPDDRDRLMNQSEWSVDLNNYRELGGAIASFNKLIGNDPFVGTAEMTVEDGMRVMVITLYHDETIQFTCENCSQIYYEPVKLCTFCWQRICGNCWKGHEKGHWRPQKTIGGDLICREDHPCGKDGCPTCEGISF